MKKNPQTIILPQESQSVVNRMRQGGDAQYMDVHEDADFGSIICQLIYRSRGNSGRISSRSSCINTAVTALGRWLLPSAGTQPSNGLIPRYLLGECRWFYSRQKKVLATYDFLQIFFSMESVLRFLSLCCRASVPWLC